jgi:hypothetical protein
MKKIYSVVLAVLLVFALTMSVSAAVSSPEKEVSVTGGSVTLTDGTVVSGKNVGSFVSVKKGTTASAGGNGYSSVGGSFDIQLADGVASSTVQVYLAGVKVGDTVSVRMLVDGEWVTIEGAKVVAENTVEIPVTAAGTYDVLVPTSDEGNESEGNGSGTGTGTGTGNGTGTGSTTSNSTTSTGSNSSTTSPKTGEGAQLPAAVMAAMVFGVCAVLSGRKARKAA